MNDATLNRRRGVFDLLSVPASARQTVHPIGSPGDARHALESVRPPKHEISKQTHVPAPLYDRRHPFRQPARKSADLGTIPRMTRCDHSAFKDQFSDRAAGYAAYRPHYPPELIDYLASLTPRCELAWDCGCGSGQLSVPLAAHFDCVIATDASESQLAQASPHPRIQYRQALAEACGIPDHVVDLAVSAQAAHWFKLPAYYAEVRRTARGPDSLIALVCYGILTVDEIVNPVISNFYTKVLADHWGPERRHVEAGYQSLAFPFDELPSPNFEIRLNWTLDDMVGYVETWSATRNLRRAEGHGAVNALRRALEKPWGSPESTRMVRWPLALRVGRVHSWNGRV